MPDPTLWGLFVVASIVLLLTPGPAVLYIVARSVEQGRAAGLVSVLGIHLGTIVHITAAAIGLSALLVSSALAFAIVKYLGAAYLIWIGVPLVVRAWRDRNAPLVSEPMPSPTRVYWQGLTTNLLNPKVAIFYVAFLPQFVSPELGHASLQLLLLGLTHWLMGLPYLCAVALASGSTAAWFRSSPGIRRALDAAAGFVFVGLAMRLALVKRKPA